MDLHSIISYHPHPHRPLHKLKKKKKKIKKKKKKKKKKGEEVFLRRFSLTRRSRVHWEKMQSFGWVCVCVCVWGVILLHEHQVIACYQTHPVYWPPKVPLLLLLWTSRIHFHCLPLWRKYAPEVKAAKGLKRCQVKVKGVNKTAWTPNICRSRLLHWSILRRECPYLIYCCNYVERIHYCCKLCRADTLLL